jgi:N-acyl-D-aspartate/D-glutamate deacylase
VWDLVISESARREFDAKGDVVVPGFIDVDTHLDAQVFWEPLGGRFIRGRTRQRQ